MHFGPLWQRDSTDADVGQPDESLYDPSTEEIFQSWAIFILILLLIWSLWSSYFLQERRIKGFHESLLSIIAGMIVGFIIRISPGHFIQSHVSFSYSYFFNVLLPPIILNSGYELNQSNFFRNIFSILTFALPGTFFATITLGVILYLWTLLGIEDVRLQFVDAVAVSATLSATDPATVLSIFSSYHVDPKLYTIISGESLLNDAVCIVIFETAQRLKGENLKFGSFFKGTGIFLVTFTISMIIGALTGILTALTLKYSHVRRYPQIETCLVLLFAYATYFFSNGCHMSGIVSLLFCGMTMKHYAFFNMSRRTQIAIKYTFQLMAQLSENFIFIYLGLTLFTEEAFVFRPLLIVVTFFGICLARYTSVFPLSRLINQAHRLASRNRDSIPEEIPDEYQFMLFWAGLRGAVGVALAAGIEGDYANELRATILVVVVFTVIIFGSTTSQVLELLGIQTGVPSEQEMDDEFDIEVRPRFDSQHVSSGFVDDIDDLEINASEAMAPPETARWFRELDSRVFRPVLLDTHPN